MVLKDKITSVTVYRDRAQVTRSASVKLSKGEHELVFDSLPAEVDPESLQVSGSGPATIGSVQFTTVHFAEEQNARRKALQDRRQELTDKMQDADSAIVRAKGEKAFVESIAKRLTGITPTSAPADLDPERWIRMTSFYRERLDALDEEMKATERSKRALSEEIEKIDAELEEMGEDEDRTRNQAQVALACAGDAEVTLELAYIVPGPSWVPVYDIRVASKTRRLTVACNALVQQATSEAWESVRLLLSTAQPQVGGAEPELSPWRVQFYQPAPQVMMASAPAADSVRFARRRAAATEDVEGAPALREEAEAACEPMEAAQATVETGATAVVFAIPGQSTIGNDNEPQRVTVTVQEFDAEFSYSTTPKLTPRAFLRAKARNQTEFPFLAGQTNVFLDSAFVAHAGMELVAPGQEFTTFLGIDESIKVEHKFIRRYQKDEGVLSKRTRFIYEYLFEITNNRATEEKLRLRDQLPIAGHEDIGVELLDPKPGKGNAPKKDEQSLLEWELTLKAGEKLKMPFVFAVEYPRGRNVTGL